MTPKYAKNAIDAEAGQLTQDAEDAHDVWLKRVGGVQVTLKPPPFVQVDEGAGDFHLTGHIVASDQVQGFRVELAKLMAKHNVEFVSVALVQLRQRPPQATEAS